ncbi:uncharacterized protein [Henckelia pumila]|uniref:uncharacterized protein n=1 Tax=Henckelia pumila TaxID=405737 RepID=UPI003C6E1A8E
MLGCANMCDLRHRLRNNTNRTLYLRDMTYPGTYTMETRLDPNDIIDNFPAARYCRKNLRFICLSTIVVFVDNEQAFGGLLPEDFIAYFELIFEIDERSNTLIVSGIRAQSTDYFPCRCMPLWNRFTESGRLREIVMISGFKGHLLSDEEMMTIFVMINYDGERKKNDKGGYIWSSGAHANWEAISVDRNNLTLDGVADQICRTLGLNGVETKLMFSHLPESYVPHPHYIQDSQTLEKYLTFGMDLFDAIPQLHVKYVEEKK